MVENDDWNLIQKLYRSTGTSRSVCSHLYRTAEGDSGTRAQLCFCEYGMAATFIYIHIQQSSDEGGCAKKERELNRYGTIYRSYLHVYIISAQVSRSTG